jgi:hypothetical protein
MTWADPECPSPGLRLPGIRRTSGWHAKLPRHSPETKCQDTSSATTTKPSAAYSDAASTTAAAARGREQDNVKSRSKAIVGTTKRSIDAIPSAWL